MTKATQKKLLQAIETCKGMLASTGWSAASWLPVRQQMDQFQKMLPEDAGSVTEIITSLQQALQALSEKMDTDTAQETRELVSDLLTAAADRVASLPVKKLFVFLPYKASMWDSLESIWRAAAADKEHCETLVIPIPYCDRDKDMSAKEWHCEANSFPSDIPVEDWRKYRLADLEQLHPDVIFIHNPYDELNTVTSVDSDYYSSNLKRCTDNLVYVPYFVSGDTIAPHFCQTRGVVNADHVIVESEKIKVQYEKYYPNGQPPKGKFLALGSPKFDKVVHTARMEQMLPPAWRKCVYRPDGSRKIVALYNTGLSALLRAGERAIAKYEKVLQFFRERQTDMALLWRPHPLLDATLASMRPELYDRYQAMVQRYREEGWGIYDDTPELDRAIALCDVYYGDPSSVIELVKAVGKPVLLQDMYDMERFRATFALCSHWVQQEGDSLWLVSEESLAFFQFSISSGQLLRTILIPEAYCESAFHYFWKQGNEVYFIPCNAKDGWCLHLDGETWERLDLGLTEEDKKRDAKFVYATEYKGKLFLFGCAVSGITIYDTQTREHRRIAEAWAEINGQFVVRGHKAYLPVLYQNVVLELDMERETVCPHPLDLATQEPWYTIFGMGDSLVLVDQYRHEVWLDASFHITKQRQLPFPQGSEICAFHRILVHGDRIVYIPVDFSFIGWKKRGEEDIHTLALPYPLLDKFPEGSCMKHYFSHWMGDQLLLQERDTGRLLWIDFANGVEERSLRLPEESMEKIQKALQMDAERTVYAETPVLSLDVFLPKIAGSFDRKKEERAEGVIGQRIWQYFSS